MIWSALVQDTNAERLGFPAVALLQLSLAFQSLVVALATSSNNAIPTREQ